MAIKLRFFIVTIALVFSACFSPWQDDKGMFSVSIGGGNSRKIADSGDDVLERNPDISVKDLLHIVTITSPDHNKPQEKRFTGAGAVSFTVAPGFWHIDVKAYEISDVDYSNIENIVINDKEPPLVAIGFGEFDVKAGKNNTVPITMSQPVELPPGPEPSDPTTGTAVITIIWENDDGKIELVPEGNVNGITISGEEKFTVKVNWPAIQFEEISCNWYLWGIPIAGNADGSITISAEDYNPGTYQLMVMVYKDNIPYSAEISFTVE